jgi:hypothetical protein
MDAVRPRPPRAQRGDPGTRRRFVCWLCEATADFETLLASGWTLQADDRVAACPKHAYRTPGEPGFE